MSDTGTTAVFFLLKAASLSQLPIREEQGSESLTAVRPKIISIGDGLAPKVCGGAHLGFWLAPL